MPPPATTPSPPRLCPRRSWRVSLPRGK
jgi:hypothetical protein